MKKIIALLLAALLLVSMTACKAKQAEEAEAPGDPVSQAVDKAEAAAQTEAEAQANAQTETPSDEASEPVPPPVVVTPDEMVGSWKLSGENDLEELEQVFPEVREIGGAMEVGMDGLMFWTIGTFGGAGNFTVDGETVTAAVYSDHNGSAETAICTLDPTGETLTMEYSGVTIIWSRD